MTITYSADVANSSITALGKTLWRWRGSLWKSVWKELLCWCICYAIISVCYRLWMDDSQKETFEDIAALCFKYSEYIPLTFMLGFFVTQVVNRWTFLFNNLGWCDNYSLYTAAYLQGSDERSRLMRRAVVRYMGLLQVLVFRDISLKFRRRFPTMECLVEAGYMTEQELVMYEAARSSYGRYWIPVRWAMGVIGEARREGKIDTDFGVQDIYGKMIAFRNLEFNLILYDWVPLPLVYTQVVFVTVRVYFLVALLGRQYLLSSKYDELRGPLDAYVPLFTIFQFVFYVGWLKVAEALLNPFGEDDDDFETNFVVDRNMGAAFKIVDEDGASAEVKPRLVKDAFWNDAEPAAMYSKETARLPQNPQVGSAAANFVVPSDPIVMVPRGERSEGHFTRGASMRASVSNALHRFASQISLNRRNKNTQDTYAHFEDASDVTSSREGGGGRSISQNL